MTRFAIIASDTDYDDTTITSVEEDDTAYSFTRADNGFSFWCKKEYNVVPKVGDFVRFYPAGIGRAVRGLVINGHVLYYKTAEEQKYADLMWLKKLQEQKKSDFEAQQDEFYARIEALPEVFQRRIQNFIDTNPDFLWENGSYELMCCEQAVLFATELKTVEAVKEFHDMDWEAAQRLVPGLEEGHSGNSFAFSCRLAMEYLTDPELVVKEHGALVLLVGCKKYGCPHESTKVDISD